MKTKVYLFDSKENAELLFKEFINRTDNGGAHKYKWTGIMGFFDLDDNRIYCMTKKHFKTWEKTHTDFTTANGDGVVKGVIRI